MNYWLRLYTSILDDMKVHRLSDGQFRGWIKILCLAKEGDGLLPSVDEVAFRLRISEAEAQSLTEELVRRGLLESDGEHLSPHNWDSRQFLSDADPTAALRARRYRDRMRDVARDATGGDTDEATEPSRPSEQRQSRAETEPETEQSRGVSGGNPSPAASRAKPRSARPACDEEFFDECQRNPAYAALDIRMVYHKMVLWCQNKGKQPTRSRLLNWLSREEKPMTAKLPPPKTGNAHVGKSQPAPVTDNNDFMCNTVENLIAEEDILLGGQMYDEILERGGAKAEWEIRLVAWYELRKDEPATPAQVAQLKRQISALANNSRRQNET
jgi:hypothetical protein